MENKIARVLLVEDSEAFQRLVSSQLKNAGFDVVVAKDGRDGVAAVLRAKRAEKPFDLVFMDIDMPRMDGYEATARIRKRDMDLPVIALTGQDLPTDRQKCFDAGCTEYIAKPIDKVTLLRIIDWHIK